MWEILVPGFLLIGCIIFAYVLVIQWQKDKQSSSVLAEVERQNSAYAVPIEAIEQYEDARYALFEQTWGSDKPLPGTEEEWMNQLSEEDNKALRTLLMKRAIANIPRSQEIQKDLPGFSALYRKQLISEEAWRTAGAAKEALVNEIELVREEASRLKADWGQSIFSEAFQLFRHQQEKMQEAASVKEAERTRKIKIEEEKQRLERQERLAAKRALELIREEEAAEKKKKK
eukprot:Platyproteum_vivax@DN3299_c0_g1_i1.p1